MKKLLNIWLGAMLMFFAACSDDVHPDPELGGPLYGLQKGEPGSVDELIYNTWEDCGVYYLYDYNQFAFQVLDWSGYFNKWYTPVKEGNDELIKKVINTIHKGVFAGMDNDFIHRNWFVRVFLCDSLCDAASYDKYDLVDTYLGVGETLIIPNVGEKMQKFTDEDWEKWEKAFADLMISRLFLGAESQPVEFFALRYRDPITNKVPTYFLAPWDPDPENEYSPNVYTFRTKGYLRSVPKFGKNESIFAPDEKMDVADYIDFLTKSPKTEMEHVFARFPKVKERAIALIPYLKNVLGMDITGMQNVNVPDDKVESNYFDGLHM